MWPPEASGQHPPVVQSPRAILQKQRDRCAEHGWDALAGTELESTAFDTSYEEAHDRHYRDLTPANQYNVDYSILGTTRVEPLLRDIRNHMYAAGLDVEGAKGECNFGQHEVGFLYAEALNTADNHVVYKNAAKEIAAQHGKSVTFMAKPNQREGSSCHIHLSLRGTDGGVVFADDEHPHRFYVVPTVPRVRQRADGAPLLTAVLLASALPAVFWSARAIVGYSGGVSVIIAGLFGISPITWYAFAHVSPGQLLAAQAVVWLTWAGVSLWRGRLTWRRRAADVPRRRAMVARRPGPDSMWPRPGPVAHMREALTVRL